MAAPSTVKELQYRLDKAKLRAEKRQSARLATPKAYTKRPEATTLIYHDPLDVGRWIATSINTQSIAQLGTAATFGLYTEAEIAAIAAETRPTPISNRSIKSPMIKMTWFYGGETGTVHNTAWGTRVVTFAQVKNTLKYHSAYFSIKSTTAVTVDAVIAAFQSLWTAAKIESNLGAKGSSTLYIGKTPLITIKA